MANNFSIILEAADRRGEVHQQSDLRSGDVFYSIMILEMGG